MACMCEVWLECSCATQQQQEAANVRAKALDREEDNDDSILHYFCLSLCLAIKIIVIFTCRKY